MSYGVVYLVTNKVNGKKYVGQTTRSIEERWRDHVRQSYRYENPFPRALINYKEDDFYTETLCECFSQQELDEKEIFYIEKLKTIAPFGYNCTYGGRGGKHLKEVKNKISKSLMGKVQSEETKMKRSKSLSGENSPCYGKEKSNEIKEKISTSLKKTYYDGYKHPMLGKQHSQESIEKMSKTYMFVSPIGELITIKNLHKFCRESSENLITSKMVAVNNGRRNSHKGWTKYKEVMDVIND